MRNIKSAIAGCLLTAASGLLYTSCDALDLKPLDFYGSESYWKKESHISSFMDGMHANLRDVAYQHFLKFGEARGGSFKLSAGIDGPTPYDWDIKLQLFDETHTGVSNFGDLYGKIANVNLFIDRTLAADYMATEKKAYYLGQAYGLRAFYYFDLYRIYGGVPLRLTPDVMDGEIDPSKLYMKRSTPKAVMTQIKADLTESLSYFDLSGKDKAEADIRKSYWSKAATESLIGEVYLWTSKVTTGDDVANEADLITAKKHLLNVANNYGFGLEDFSRVFSAKAEDKGGKEIIMTIRYAEGEASNSMVWFVYSWEQGNFSSFFDETGKQYTNVFGSSGTQGHEYKKELFLSFDKEDTRRDATFLPAYTKSADGTLSLAGTYIKKNIGYVNSANVRVYCGDLHIYRLPLIYLMLAEIENMQGGDVAKYINYVRERAYGSKWDETIFGYKNADFTTNELAILHEKDKEFVTEGQRWWDVRRMTLTKGGEHLVFCKEGNIGSDTSILSPDRSKKEWYTVLWPIEKSLLDSDPELSQTPDYPQK